MRNWEGDFGLLFFLISMGHQGLRFGYPPNFADDF
jgi:hypothetical protein